jgi:hypothetical protein
MRRGSFRYLNYYWKSVANLNRRFIGRQPATRLNLDDRDQNRTPDDAFATAFASPGHIRTESAKPGSDNEISAPRL